jgi:hypothetical protein
LVFKDRAACLYRDFLLPCVRLRLLSGVSGAPLLLHLRVRCQPPSFSFSSLLLSEVPSAAQWLPLLSSGGARLLPLRRVPDQPIWSDPFNFFRPSRWAAAITGSSRGAASITTAFQVNNLRRPFSSPVVRFPRAGAPGRRAGVQLLPRHIPSVKYRMIHPADFPVRSIGGTREALVPHPRIVRLAAPAAPRRVNSPSDGPSTSGASSSCPG